MEHIHIGRGTTNMGTFRVDEVRQGLLTGRFFSTDLGWREGMEKWLPLSEIPDLAAPAPAETATGTPQLPESIVPSLPATDLGTERNGLPWEHRTELGTLNAWAETLKVVLLDPARAFTAMRLEGGLLEPLFYALIGGTIGGVFGALYEMFRISHGAHSSPYTATTLLGACIFMPVLVALVTFLHSALVHLSLMVLGGANRPFETTFRTLSFSSGSAALLQVVPVCGGVIAVVWNLVALSIGLSKTHGISTGKAVCAVLLPTIVCCGVVTMAVVAITSGVAAAAASR